MKRNLMFIALLSLIGWSNVFAQIPTDGLLAKWCFENDLIDSGTNGYNLTGPASYSSGIVGDALNASEVYITNSTLKSFIDNNNPWCVSFWFKSNQVINEQTVMFAVDGPSSYPYQRVWICLTGSNIDITRFNATTMSGHGSIGSYFGSDLLNLDNSEWHHLALNYTGSTFNLFIDNTETLATNPSQEYIDHVGSSMGTSNATSVTFCGNQQNNVASFPGMIDQVYIYSRVLTSTEIGNLFNEGGLSTLNQGLEAYYPFNGNANDESWNGHNGVVNGATLVADRFGNSNKAYSFDGVNDFIDVGTSSSLGVSTSNVLTFSFWADGNGNNQYPVISKISSFCIYNDINELRVFGTGNDVMIIPTNIDNLQHYVVVLQSGTNNTKVYINGTLAGTGTIEYHSTISTYPLYFGKYNQEGNVWYKSGVIDDIRIYNRALNEAEIHELYTEGLISTISIANKTVKVGQSFDISVYSSNIKSSDSIISYQFNFDYDETKMQYVSASVVGTIAADGFVLVNSNTAGHLVVGYTTTTPLSGAGNLVKLHFTALAEGTSALTISNFLFNATSITDITNGVVTILENIPPTAALTYSDSDALVHPGELLTITATFNEAMADSPVPQLVLSGATTLAAANMTKVSSTVYTYSYTVEDVNGPVNVALATGTDIAENVVVSTPTSGANFTVDNIPPTAAILYSDADGNVHHSEVLTITATFSEAMVDAPFPQIILSGANILSATDMTKVSNTVYTYTYTINSGDGIVNVSLSTGTDIAGNVVVLAPTSGGSYTVIPLHYGDIDEDGNIYAYDAALTLQYSVGIDALAVIDPLPWETWRIITANVDGLGDVTANDASLILQYAIGLIDTFPVGIKNIIENVIADINITIDGNYIVFQSAGELFGLNVVVDENRQILGTPEVMDQNMMSAFNITADTYNLGLCTAYSPEEGSVIMKIPYSTGDPVDLTFNLIVNTEIMNKAVSLVGIPKSDLQNNITIHPNPVSSILTVNLKSGSRYKVTIFDTQGQLLYTINTAGEEQKIDFSQLSSGIYYMKVSGVNGVWVQKIVKE